MSVEEKPEVDELKEAEDMMVNFFYGEDDAEEPESPEQPEVEAEAEDNQDSEESEPKPPVASDDASLSQPVVQEESALPEWAQSLDIEDDEMADAVDFFAGGEKASWTRLPHKEMTEEQLGKLRKAQSEFNRWQSAQKQVEDPEVLRRKQIEEKLWERAAKLVEDKAEETPKEEPQVSEDVMSKVHELMETGETDAAIDALTKGLREENERKIAELEAKLDQRLEEKLSTKLTEKQQNDYLTTHNAYLSELADSDPRFAPALEVGSELNLALRRIFDIGVDPLTGEKIVEGKNAVEDLNRAYDYYLSRSRGGKRVVNRPSVSAQPPAGSTSGDVPEASESDLDLDWDDYFNLPHVRKEFEKLG